MHQAQIYRATELSNLNPERIPTLFDELDIAYGRNSFTDEQGQRRLGVAGLPRRKISLWAGAGGTGKSRACLSICKNVCFYGLRALYILNEDEPNAVAGWVEGITNYSNLFIIETSDCGNYIATLKAHTQAIFNVMPDIIIVDSLTGMPGITSPIAIREIMLSYKEWATAYNCHIILIAHLNKEGDIKGNNDIIFYPDHICVLRKFDKKIIPQDMSRFLMCDYYDYTNQGYFLVNFERKNRGGRIGHKLCFRHINAGVELVYGHLIGDR